MQTGRDRGGRPVLYKHCGKLSFGKIGKAGNDLATVLRYNEWIMERFLHTIDHRGMWDVIIDIAGLSMAQLASMKWQLYVWHGRSRCMSDHAHRSVALGWYRLFGSAWLVPSLR